MELNSKFQQKGVRHPHNLEFRPSIQSFQIAAILLIASIFTPNTAKSQWLQDLRTNHYNALTVQFWKAQEINETAISHKGGTTETTQTQITFSVDRKQINQSITKDGVKVGSNVFVFNQRKQIMSKTLRRSSNGTQWEFEKYTYSYNTNLLTRVNAQRLNGELIYFLNVQNDSLGYPIKVEQRSPDSTLLATETTILDRSRNKIAYQLRDANGSIISTTEGRIVVKKTGKERYNLHGDCYFYPRPETPTDNIFCNVEFDYDSNGNWLKKEIYEGEAGADGKLIDSTLVLEYKRKIKYISED